MSFFKIQLSHGVEGLSQSVKGSHSVTFPERGTVGISGISDHGLHVDDIVHVAIVKEGTTPSKLGGAAAGAALGFLLAGPLGTAIGGLAGSNRQSQDTLGSITFKSGATLLVTVDASNMGGFLSLQARYPFTGTAPVDESKSTLEVDPSNLTKECPRCAEIIKLKAMVCRYCGHEFSQLEVGDAVTKASELATRAGTQRQEEEAYKLALPKDVYIQQAPDLRSSMNAINALVDGLKTNHPNLQSYSKTHAIRDLGLGKIKVAERVSADIAEEIRMATEGFATILIEDAPGKVAGQVFDLKLQILSKHCEKEAIQLLSDMGVAADDRVSIIKRAMPGFFGVSSPVLLDEGVDKQRVQEWETAVADKENFSVDAEPVKAGWGNILLNTYLELR
jgi:hypothetical protein